MTQRNPMNPRNQQGYAGVSRKSASSAKPVKQAGASVYTRSAAARTKAEEKQRKEEQKEQDRKQRRRMQAADAMAMQTSAYKKWRRLWIICIVIAVVCVALSWGINALEDKDLIPASASNVSGAVAAGVLIAGYVFIIACLVIDFKKIRPIRKEQEARVESMSKRELRELDEALESKSDNASSTNAGKPKKRWGKKHEPQDGDEG